jgi:PIN domain nuclease of toxin-antitoxin system
MDTLPITALDAETAARLPMHHADPFDRMLVAQAQRLDALIVSRDRLLDAYDVDVLPA